MNIVMRIAYATFDFVVINTLMTPILTDPMSLAWYSLCIALAYALRLGMENKRKALTKQVLLYQSVCTVTWCFFSILVWTTFLNYTRGFEIYLFLNSLFAVFLVGQLDDVFQMGVKAWLRIKLKEFLTERPAENKKEVEP